MNLQFVKIVFVRGYKVKCNKTRYACSLSCENTIQYLILKLLTNANKYYEKLKYLFGN